MSQTIAALPGPITIEHWLAIPDRQRLMPGLDQVFFDSSATTSFADDELRRAFRHRWLGRYLEHYAEWTFVALNAEGDIVGYIVGSHDDPAKTPLFSDIGYFQDFAALTAEYPAQLHVNVSPDWRGHGIGARLMQTFVAEIARAGVSGVHVVTTRGMRNVRYYMTNSFAEVGSAQWNSRVLVLLGRKLTSADTADTVVY